MESLEILKLWNNKIKHIPEALGKLEYLRELDLGYNPISGQELAKAQELLPDTKIKHVDPPDEAETQEEEKQEE